MIPQPRVENKEAKTAKSARPSSNKSATCVRSHGCKEDPSKYDETRFFEGEKGEEHFLSMIDLSKKLNHPSILHVKQYDISSHNPSVMVNTISGKTLNDVFMEKKISEISHTRKAYIIYGIANFMEYLHMCGVIQCNLNPSQIAMDKEYKPYLADYSSCIYGDYQPKEYCDFSDARYIAPEILIHEPITEKVDVYSYAMILYFLFAERAPFTHLYDNDEIKGCSTFGKRPTLPSNLKPEILNLVHMCWAQNPSERPSFTDVKNYIKDNITRMFPNISKGEFETYIHEVEFSEGKVIHRKLAHTNSSDYSMTKKLYQSVFLMVNKDDGDEIVVKKLRQMPNGEVPEEIAFISELDHFTIAQCWHLTLSSPTIVMPYYHNGNVQCLLNKLDNTRKAIIILGLAAALEYVHYKSIIHCDIKPGNIVLDENNEPKLLDFGSAIRYVPGKALPSNVGTPIYMAPEVFDSTDYGFDADVYSFGITIYQIITGKQPYAENKLRTVFEIKNFVEYGGRPLIPNTVNKNTATLIRQCWSPNRASRPSFSKIVDEIIANENFLEDINSEVYHEYVNKIISNRPQ